MKLRTVTDETRREVVEQELAAAERDYLHIETRLSIAAEADRPQMLGSLKASEARVTALHKKLDELEKK